MSKPQKLLSAEDLKKSKNDEKTKSKSTYTLDDFFAPLLNPKDPSFKQKVLYVTSEMLTVLKKQEAQTMHILGSNTIALMYYKAPKEEKRSFTALTQPKPPSAPRLSTRSLSTVPLVSSEKNQLKTTNRSLSTIPLASSEKKQLPPATRSLSTVPLVSLEKKELKTTDQITIPSQTSWPYRNPFVPCKFKLKTQCSNAEILDFIHKSSMPQMEVSAAKDLETNYLHIISVYWEKAKQAIIIVTPSSRSPTPIL